MTVSEVFFMDLRATYKENLIDKLGRLMETAGFADCIRPKRLVAVKLHFGELGNTAYLRPVFIRKIVQQIEALGGAPFLTDANTLYAGTRSDAPRHLITAVQNGFAFSVVGAPLVIADGLRGASEQAVQIRGKHFQTVYIAKEIFEADAIVSTAHFKGHELAGFGGTLKNLGMGCASRKGKMAQHATVAPRVKKKRCVGCGDCAERCAQKAIAMIDGKAFVQKEKCVGCGECILVCPNGAVQIQWDQSIPDFLERMAEYTLGVLQGKSGRVFFLNFITDVAPTCDCMPVNDAPIVRDIGVVAGRDPVAVDQASVDLVNQEAALPGSCLEVNTLPGEDKFKGVHPRVDWEIQLDHAEALGLGRRRHTLVKI